MFRQIVGSLPIGVEFTGLSIRDPYNYYPELELNDREYNPERALADYILVEDICMSKCSPYYQPDYIIRGNFIYGNRFNRIFRICPDGNHLLCFTGKPKEDNNPIFRLDNTIYKHYWEDNDYGYLTQIIEATELNIYTYFNS